MLRDTVLIPAVLNDVVALSEPLPEGADGLANIVYTARANETVNYIF